MLPLLFTIAALLITGVACPSARMPGGVEDAGTALTTQGTETTPPPGSGPPTRGANPAVEVAPVAFPIGVPQSYSWLEGGHEVGRTTFTLRKVVPPGAPARLVLDATWRHSARGREHNSKNITELNPSTHELLSWRQELRTAAGKFKAGELLEARAERGILEVSLNAGGRVIRNDMLLPAGALPWGNQALEHMALIAGHLRGPSTTLQLVRPRDLKICEVTFEREAVERRKEGVTWTRYQMTGPAVKAKIWVDAAGVLEVYEQGEVTIRRISAKRPRRG